MSELSDEEKKISKMSIWVWRNLLASGVFLVCFGFLYNKLSTLDDHVKELKTKYQTHAEISVLFMKRERGDFGWSAMSVSEPEFESQEEAEKYYDEMRKKRRSVSNSINEYLDEK